MSKLKTLAELKRILSREKMKGRTIVLANGCFDLIHAGHVRYLRDARQRGDLLVLALNSDSSVRQLKGAGRPLMSQKERAEILSSFASVDHIVIFDEPNVEKVLRTLRPDIHAKGSDYSEDTVPERATVKRIGGRVAITGGPKIRNTSDIMAKIADATARPDSPHNFLIIRLSSLGDIIHALPAFAALRKHCPEAKISWAVEPAGRPILECVPGLDEILVIEKGHLLRNIRTIRMRDRVALDFQGLAKSGALAWLSGARRRIGFHRRNLKEPVAAIFYTERMAEIPETIPVISKNLGLLAGLGIREQNFEFPIRLPAQASERAKKLLDRLGRKKRQKTVVCNLGAAWSTKRWPADKWVGVLERMKKKRPGLFFVLLWGKQEEEQAAEEVALRTGVPIVPYLSLQEVMALIKEAALLVSGDTFALQAACALNVPVVGIFGPTNPRRNGPFRKRDLVAYHGLDCAPCYLRDCPTAKCLEVISSEEVAALALQTLKERVNA